MSKGKGSGKSKGKMNSELEEETRSRSVRARLAMEAEPVDNPGHKESPEPSATAQRTIAATVDIRQKLSERYQEMAQALRHREDMEDRRDEATEEEQPQAME